MESSTKNGFSRDLETETQYYHEHVVSGMDAMRVEREQQVDGMDGTYRATPAT